MDIKWGHWGAEVGQVGGGVGALGGLGGAPFIAHRHLVVGDGEWGAVEEGVGQYGGAHTGGSVVLVSGFGGVRNANTG